MTPRSPSYLRAQSLTPPKSRPPSMQPGSLGGAAPLAEQQDTSLVNSPPLKTSQVKSPPSFSSSEELQAGVRKVREMQASWSPRMLALVYVSIILLASLTSLDGQVNYLFIPYITSDFSAHALLATIQIISAVLQTILKAPAAKIADVFGRVEALMVGVVFYVLGYICMAASTSIWWYGASQIFYIGGSTGTQFLTQLIVADTSSMLNRALVSTIPFVPFLWTVWAGPPLGEALLDNLGWRWGIGIWAFIIPVAAAPLIVLMYVHQRNLNKDNLASGPLTAEPLTAEPVTREAQREIQMAHSPSVKQLLLAQEEDQPRTPATDAQSPRGPAGETASLPEESSKRPWWRSFLHYCDQMDMVGTLIASAGLALLLVPLTLASRSPDRWASVNIILPMCLGAVMFVGFVFYELKVAHVPLVSLRLLRTPSVFFACFAGFFYFFSYYVGRLYFPSYLQVAAFVGPSQAGHINNAMTFTSTGVGVLTGLAIKYTKTLRPYVLSGTVIYIVGLGMLVFFRTPDTAIWAMVLSQVVLGFGAGLFSTPNTVLVQSHASHQDLSSATALSLVITTLGWSTGAAVAGAIWTNSLPQQLEKRLPEAYKDMASEISADITVAMSFPAGTDVRTAINDSYYYVMQLLCIVGVCLGACQLVCVLCCKTGKQMHDTKDAVLDDENPTDKPLVAV